MLVSPIGGTLHISLIADRETGCLAGFGFVEMSDADADGAISRLNGQDFDGRLLPVSAAAERINRARGFSDSGNSRSERW